MNRRLNLFNVDAEARATAELALSADDSLVAVDDPLHETQAQADPAGARRSRGIRPIKPLEHVRQDVWRHADPGVDDVKPGLSLRLCHTHLDSAAPGRELEGVVEQVEQHALQPFRVALDG